MVFLVFLVLVAVVVLVVFSGISVTVDEIGRVDWYVMTGVHFINGP